MTMVLGTVAFIVQFSNGATAPDLSVERAIVCSLVLDLKISGQQHPH